VVGTSRYSVRVEIPVRRAIVAMEVGQQPPAGNSAEAAPRM
jgi:hypothetical protein